MFAVAAIVVMLAIGTLPGMMAAADEVVAQTIVDLLKATLRISPAVEYSAMEAPCI